MEPRISLKCRSRKSLLLQGKSLLNAEGINFQPTDIVQLMLDLESVCKTLSGLGLVSAEGIEPSTY